MTNSRDSRAWTARMYQERVDEIVARLRSMADEVERAAKPYDKPGASGTPRYVAATEAVLHAISWGMANANAQYLITSASLADAAERGELDPKDKS